MIIERIEIENWMPFKGKFDLDLPPGAIAVTAKYEENALRSNWAGKTAFLEAIEWALFGVHRKRLEDAVINHEADHTKVVVRLTGGVVVTRSRKRGKATQFFVEYGEEKMKMKKKAAEKALKDFLGVDHVDYRATTCFAQGDTSAIVSMTSSKRREVLSAWLELEPYKDVVRKVRDELKTYYIELENAKKQLERLQENEIEVDPKEVGTTAGRLFAAVEEKEAIDVLLEKARLAEHVADEKARYERIKSEAKDRFEKIRSYDVKVIKSELEDIEETKDQASEKLAVLKRDLSKAVELSTKGFDGKCPVNKKSCPIASEINEETEHNKEVLVQIKKKRDDFEKTYSKLESRWNSLKRDLNRHERLVEEQKRSIETLREMKTRPVFVIEEVDVSEVKSKYRDLIETSNALRRKLSQLVNDERQSQSVAKMREDAEAAYDDVKEISAMYGYANRVAASMPGAVIDRSIARLEERANALLDGTGLSIQFSTDRATQTLSDICSECGHTYRGQRDKSCPSCGTTRPFKTSDDLEIMVTDGSGDVEDARMKSGGAKVLIGSAIRLAASLLLREFRDARIAFAQIDEPFGPLDAENRTNLARVFSSMLSGVGLEQALVVSHDTALLDSLPARVLITRTQEGNSTICLE